MEKSKILLLILIIILISAGIAYAAEPLISSQEPEQNSSRKTPRIVGGREAEPGAWNWMAALVYNYKSDIYDGAYCGGSLIHSRWVLTAGHCVKYDWNSRDMAPNEIDVVFGLHDLKNDTGERVNVKRIISHPNYDSQTLDFDIALLELEHEVGYTPISPYSGKDTLEGAEATVIGWGKTNPNTSNYPSKLREVSVPIVPNQICEQAYKKIGDDVTDNMLCAGYADGGKDACIGDSGGPLMIWDETAWKVAGIVSWGEGCAEPNFYGVYTRVSKFTDFIAQYVYDIPNSSNNISGDFNGDGKVGIDDVIGIFQVKAKTREMPSSVFRDFNGDGKWEMEDAVRILQMLTGASSLLGSD